MAAIELPALVGGKPLGFLAALGALRLLDERAASARAGDRVRLSWGGEYGAHAVVHHPRITGLDELVDEVAAVVEAIPADAVLPGVPADFPPSADQRNPGGDPMRVPREDFAGLCQLARDRGPESALWLRSIVTDMALDAKQRCALTPLMAPAGRQAVRSFFAAPLHAIRPDPRRYLREAFTQWRRQRGVTGEQLDHQSYLDAGESPDGKAYGYGVPGATWLATMALPLLFLTGDGRQRASTFWRRTPDGREIMLWPLWQPPIGVDAIKDMASLPNLGHPRLIGRGRVVVPRIVQTAGPQPHAFDGEPSWDPTAAQPDQWDLERLGVIEVWAADRLRRTGIKHAGWLAPLEVLISE